jgi:hypothetical protein
VRTALSHLPREVHFVCGVRVQWAPSAHRLHNPRPRGIRYRQSLLLVIALFSAVQTRSTWASLSSG